MSNWSTPRWDNVGVYMLQTTYNFIDKNSVKLMDTCATILLVMAGMLFADNLGTLFLITMSLLLLQEIVRTDNISGRRLCYMTIFGLILTVLTVLSGPAISCAKAILQLIYWAN